MQHRYFPGNGKVTKGFPEGDSEFPPPEPPLKTAKGGHPLLIPPIGAEEKMKRSKIYA